MPQIGTTSKPKVKAGEHLLTLVAVKPYISQNKFAKKRDDFGNETSEPDPDALREQFIWDFESDEKNDFDESLTYAVFTNTNYGNEKASLTKFLNQVIPGLAKTPKQDAIDSVRHMNTDDLIGTRYKAILRDQMGKNGPFVGHTDIAPLLNADGSVERVFVQEEVPV